MKYLASCSIVKDESSYIKRFYEIHKHLGVELFLFYDRSTIGPPLTEIFKGHDDVQIIHFPEPLRHADAQLAGREALEGIARWVQFVDIDQVVVPLHTKDIKEMLQDYEDKPALGLNWHTFGSNGLEVEPTSDVSTYEAYTKRAIGTCPINNHIQSIVQVEKAERRRWDDPHHPPLPPGLMQSNEHKRDFKGPFNVPPTQDIGFIAHYYTRSREYWEKKLAKARADTGTPCGTMADFDHHQSYANEIEDLTIKNIWEDFKESSHG